MDDILWNIPEQKTGIISILGGNSQNFSNIIKNSEYLSKLPIKEVRTVLPDALKSKLPPLSELVYTKSTISGSFDKSPELIAAISDADLALLIGDFSKNSATTIAISDTIKKTATPIILARDSIDCVTAEASAFIERPDMTIIATITQLQKLLRVLYYPRMLLLSMPMQPVKEILHKFTLTYPCLILTVHQGQVIIAKNGEIKTTPLSKTTYSPISFWTTDLAAKITALKLWNPTRDFDCIQTAISVSELTARR